MRSPARLRPSPSMAVALVALFVALGGVGYAAATGSIDSREIKNNSVRGKDVKNGTIASKDIQDKSVSGADVLTNSIGPEDIRPLSSADIAPNSLGGVDIDESTLGNVNSATNATSALNATNALNSSTVSTVRTIPVKTINEGGPDVNLISAGPFAIIARCFAFGGSTQSALNITTSEDNANVQGSFDNDTDFDVAEPFKTLDLVTDGAGAPPTASVFDGGVFSALATGSGLGAMTGNIPAWVDADGGPGNTGQCKFHGHVVLSG